MRSARFLRKTIIVCKVIPVMQWTLRTVKDYYQTGNDPLWKKHMGGQEKPANWDMGYYPWYYKKQNQSRKRKTS